MKNIFKVISLEVYPFDVCVSINQTDEELISELDGNEVDCDYLLNLPSTCVGRFVMTNNNLSIIRFKIHEQINHEIIAHEIFHCVTFVMDRVGMKFKLLVSDEAYAYLIGYLTKEVYKTISDHFVDANKMV